VNLRKNVKETKVLLVEDDEMTSEIFYDYLVENGFEVDPVFTATDCMAYVRNKSYDILILDINLPDFDGFEVLKSIKKQKSLPVIVISAYSDTKSKLTAFKYGADDYMTKPIDIQELEARMWVHLRKNTKIEIGKKAALFEIRDSAIFFKQNILDLTLTEFEILSYLIKNKNKVVRREDLISSLGNINSNRSLDSHIKNIRKKINAIDSENHIKTVYGVGYQLKEGCL